MNKIGKQIPNQEAIEDGVDFFEIPVNEEFSSDEMEAGRKMFCQQCEFVAGATVESQLPTPTLPEVAFAGRSNVGKSTIINALLGQNKKARTSSNPGHTKQVNIFDLSQQMFLVDLPGYGFARASKSEIARWQGLILDYLKGRASLVRVMLLVDSRRGLKDVDHEIMKILEVSGVIYQIVFTKIDKISKKDLEKLITTTKDVIQSKAAAYPFIAMTSSKEKKGIPELRASLFRLSQQFSF